jgi:site-specific DNA-methyltransferase (cytosine-N4-specific)
VIANSESLHLPFADNTVDAAVTSPPYWGALRAYSGPQARDWPAIAYPPMPGLPAVHIPAQRVALGHEPDPYAFVGHLLQVFREVRRVLRPSAALAVNLGDSYSGGAMSPVSPKSTLGARPGRERHLLTNAAFQHGGNGESTRPGLPSKNLLLMPARLALAMQADGWILRSRMPGGAEVMPDDDVGIEPDIVWRKVATMPESVRDRPTNDFEDVLIFSQGPRYFWDQEAGREELSEIAKRQIEQARMGRRGEGRSKMAKERRDGDANVGAGGKGAAGSRGNGTNPAGRNMRSVWTINPEPTDEDHFAAWPVALASRLIRVLTSEKGVCPECGAPWVREVERTKGDREAVRRPKHLQSSRSTLSLSGRGSEEWTRRGGKTRETGWQLPCGHCDEEILAHVHHPTRYAVPATVLDPFAGLGRTWEACRATGRRFLGTDLGLGYCRLARSRNDLGAMQARKLAERGANITGPLFGTD